MKKWKLYAKLSLLIFAPLIGAFANRERGSDERFLGLPKLVWVGFMALIDTALLVGILGTVWETTWYASLGIAIAISLLGHLIILGPSWGELFKHVDKDTSQENYALGVEEITNEIMGYENTKELWDNKKFQMILDWKETGMCVRWSLYSIPKYISYSIACLSLVPLLGIGLMYLVGIFYGKHFDKQNKKGGPSHYNAVEHAEAWVGGYFKFADVLLLIIVTLMVM